MVVKDEAVRRQSATKFIAAIDQMAQDVTELLQREPALPDLRITSAQYAAGRWAFPIEYRPILERAVAQLIVHQQYKLSGAQFHLACLEGATRAGKLWIDCVLQVNVSKRCSTTARSRRSSPRVRMSMRKGGGKNGNKK